MICFLGIDRSVTIARGMVCDRVFSVWYTFGMGVALFMVDT